MPHKIILPPHVNPENFQRLKTELNIRDVFVKLLLQRGIDNFDDAKKFFRPSVDQLHNPFLMKDMEKAVSRISRAISGNEKILIYGDYDVDGTTAVASIYSFFRDQIGYQNVSFYIPDRYTEGYGVSLRGVNYAADEGVTLVIALDCGVKSVDKVAKAKELGVDFIVCDHHLPGNEMPDTVAMLNPKQAGCPYPYKELAGCGIGLKLMQALCERFDLPDESALQYLDLAAISACADIVPLTGENRVIVALGLKRMEAHFRPGVRALLKEAKFKNDRLTVEDVVFVIAPRINAAGRLEHGKVAVELLISDEEKAAAFNAESLNTNNNDRRELDKLITAEALSILGADGKSSQRKSTVVFQPHWHKGVVGIVASRLIETHYRPTVVLTESNGKATGSARTVKGFDLYKAMEACSDLFDTFGGHMHAAGLTMDISNVEKFKIRFDEIVSATITEEQLTPVIEADAEFPISEINESFYQVLKQFAPFGPGNMNPVFVSEEVQLYNHGIRTMGESGAHLQMQVWNVDRRSAAFRAVAFKQGHRFDEVYNAKNFKLAYSINENIFKPDENRSVRTLDLDVKEIIT